MNLNLNPKTYKKLALGSGFISLIGGIYYEYYRIKKVLNSLVTTDVLDIHKKRPDYIYIKYSIYRESMNQLRTMEEHDKNWINIIINPFGKWWKSIKHSIAWRLLEVAKTGNLHDRLKAIRQLSRIDNLKDWDYQHLAQICDSRTATALARNFCDTRWFLAPFAFGAVRHPKSLIYEIRHYFESLKPCKCVNHFYVNTFNRFSILKDYTYDSNYQSTDRRVPTTKQEFDCLKQCLEVLFHLTKTTENVKIMVPSGLLKTLIEIEKLFPDSGEIQFLLSKVMANISMCHEFGYDFYVSGWVGLLAQWTRSDDLRVQVTAAKALANMDADDDVSLKFKYHPRVYPLYPRTRIRKEPEVDIVFVHGLLGGVFITWRQKDREEPQLGLYGKNAFFSEETDDMFLVGDVDMSKKYSGNLIDSKRRRRQNDSKINNLPGRPLTATIYKKSSNDHRTTDNNEESVIYDESPLIGKKSLKKITSLLSDVATNELVETLQTATEVNPEWEVVFPDCPTDANQESNGPYSISGEKWVDDDKNEEYTYCWPMDWLPDDHPNARVLGVNYETNLFEWSSNKNQNCPCEKKGTLHNRAEELLHSLAASHVGQNRPIIWIGHSMGGLILKSIIIQALDSSDESIQNLAKNTEAILFLGTPHKGSAVAKLKQHVRYILSPTIEVKELEENSSYLLNLHEKFLNYIKQHKDNNVQVVSVSEGVPTIITAFKLPFHVVTEQSARMEYGDFYVLNVDHLGLSKPYYRQSFLYQRLLRIVREVTLQREKKLLEELDRENKLNAVDNGYDYISSIFYDGIHF